MRVMVTLLVPLQYYMVEIVTMMITTVHRTHMVEAEIVTQAAERSLLKWVPRIGRQHPGLPPLIERGYPPPYSSYSRPNCGAPRVDGRGGSQSDRGGSRSK